MSIATEQNILALLNSYNPWWRTNQIPDEYFKPVKRFAFYKTLRLLEHPDIRRTALLSGARRVGKTTILYQLMQSLIEKGVSPKNMFYVSFDHPLLKFCKMDKVLKVYELNISSDDDKYLFFDEVQYADDWELWLKVLYDTKPRCRVVATGSASPILAHGAGESGVGRWCIVPIPTLSFYEYCELIKEEKISYLPDNVKPTNLAGLPHKTHVGILNELLPLQKHFHRYLTVGGFPELALSKDEYFAQCVLREDVVDKVLKRDIPALFNVRNASVVEKIFLYLCYHSSNVVSVETICREVEMSRNTVENYIGFLERSNLIYVSNPISMAGKKALKARPKIYIADAAIRNAVLMQDDLLTNPAQMGLMVETAVYKHIAAFYHREKLRVGYFRTKTSSDKEIDVVVEFPQGRILVEVKYREDVNITEKDAVYELIDDKTSAALVISKNPLDFGIITTNKKVPVVKIPAHAFLYLLGHTEKCTYEVP